ncbi:MAG: D-alanyl-D-alanine carboxypeptidase [Lachnospiraceae bacterium]|nr:D-alanyl-D-alanine carboxypeptidase [Lachnospiraceae bacterium]MDD3615858.1 D-alanyl-D-alanine carboxypeptidase [Lachnospiraceae bacterium]
MKKLESIRKHKKDILRFLIVAAILVVFVLVGFFSVSSIKKTRELDLMVPYESQEITTSSQFDSTEQVAEGFANTLCVGDDNTSVSGTAVTEGEYAALFSVEDKSVLFAQNMYEKAYPASVTKIMTAILALKYGNMKDVVTIDWEMVELESGSQVCGFKIGDQVTMDELLHGLLIHSGNDAAMAIAKHVGGSINGFVKMMNDEAKSLGATGTNFVNPSGLHAENHYTTVYDIYLMLTEAMKYQEFVDIIQLSVYDIKYQTQVAVDPATLPQTEEGAAEATAQPQTQMVDAVVHVDATDKYLINEAKAPKDVTVLGGKTGTTDAAGNCLALISQNAYGKPYISIVLNAKNKDTLYTDMNALLGVINS